MANGLTEKQKDVLTKTMPKKGVTFMPWPAKFYKDEVFKYKDQGYAEAIQTPPYFLDMNSLGIRAAMSLLKKYNEQAQLSGKPMYHRFVNNRIEKDEDYEKMMNEMLALNDDITLSQIFNLAEKENEIYLSFDAYLPVIQKLAKEIVTVGNGDSFNVNITDKPQKELLIAFSSLFKPA